jgi:protein ImuA
MSDSAPKDARLALRQAGFDDVTLRQAGLDDLADGCRADGVPACATGQLHEIHGRLDDWAAVLAFAFAMARGDGDRPVILVRTGHGPGGRTSLHGAGLATLGLSPARLLIIDARDRLDLLRAALEAARCPGVAAVIVESRGRFAEYDLTASRRLALAAERSGIAVIMLRGDAQPRPSAARTRWTVASAASAPLPAQAPGLPAVRAELLRRRGGPPGGPWRLEWDEADGVFRTGNTAMPGALVPLSRLRADREPDAPDAARAA